MSSEREDWVVRETAAAAQGRLGADRMALGLASVPDKDRGDMDVIASLRSRLTIAEKALESISDYEKEDTGCCPYGCDTPTIAALALKEIQSVKGEGK